MNLLLLVNVIVFILLVFRVGLEKAKKELAGSIDKGVSFVKK